jgi:hypothetical protein
MANVLKVWADMSMTDVAKICSAFSKRLEKCLEIEENTIK